MIFWNGNQVYLIKYGIWLSKIVYKEIYKDQPFSVITMDLQMANPDINLKTIKNHTLDSQLSYKYSIKNG